LHPETLVSRHVDSELISCTLKKFQLYEGHQLGFPFGSPFLSKPLLPEVLERLPLRHRGLSSSGTENWEVLGKGLRCVVVNRTFLPGRICVSF
jgi:hypothetical protein